MDIKIRPLTPSFVSRTYSRVSKENSANCDEFHIHFGSPLPITLPKNHLIAGFPLSIYDFQIESYFCPFIMPGVLPGIQTATGVDSMTSICNAMAQASNILHQQEWYNEIIQEKYLNNFVLPLWPYVKDVIQSGMHPQSDEQNEGSFNNSDYIQLEKKLELEKDKPYFVSRKIVRRVSKNTYINYYIYFEIPYYQASLRFPDYNILLNDSHEFFQSICKFYMPGIKEGVLYESGFDSVLALNEAITKAGQIISKLEWYDEIIQDEKYENLGFPKSPVNTLKTQWLEQK